MTKEERNKRRSDARFDRKDKIVRSTQELIFGCFKLANELLWSFEGLLKWRHDHVYSHDGYKTLNFGDKRYLDGVWYTLDKQHNLPPNIVWTHILDGRRFEAYEEKHNRHGEIDTNLSYYCYKREVDGQTFFIPFRQENRVEEYKRLPRLSGQLARLFAVQSNLGLKR